MEFCKQLKKYLLGPGCYFCGQISVLLPDVSHVTCIFLADSKALGSKVPSLRQAVWELFTQGALLKCIFGQENVLKGCGKNVILEGKQVFSQVQFHQGTSLQMAHYIFVLSPLLICMCLCCALNEAFNFSRIRCALPCGTQSIIFMSVGMNMYIKYENLWRQSYEMERCPDHECCFINIKQYLESSLYLKDLSAFELQGSFRLVVGV